MKKRELALLLALVIAEAVFFIPFMRLLDRVFPGPHMGFTLLGIWLYLVLPGAVLFVILILAVYTRSPVSRRVVLNVGWLADLVLFAAAILFYRSG